MNENLDDIFKSNIKSEFPYDDKLWENYKSTYPLKNNSNKGGIYFSLAFLILAIGGLFFFLPNKESEQDIKELASQAPLKTKTSRENLMANIKKLERNQIIEKTKSIEDHSEFLESNKSTIKTKTHKIENAQIKKKNIREKNNSKVENYKTPIQNRAPKNNEFYSSNNSKETNNKNSNLNSDSDFRVININKINRLPLVDISKSNNKNSIENNKLNEYQKKNKKKFINAEIEWNRSFIISKELSDIDEQLASKKNENETVSRSLQIGINILKTKKFIQYGFGVSYISYYENSTYNLNQNRQYLDISFDTTYRIINSNYTNNGVPVTLIKEEININQDRIIENSDTLFSIRNRFQRLQIPIYIGIEKSFGLFYTNLRTSLVMNYLINEEGGYISNDLNEFIPFSDSKQTKDFLLSNRSQFSLGYYLNESFLIGTRVNYETDISSFTRDYNSRFNQISGGLWIMWKP